MQVIKYYSAVWHWLKTALLYLSLAQQDVEVSGDKDDSRLLHVVVHKPSSSIHSRSHPILSARFIFDDHIRCMAAKQRLLKGRQRARLQKMQAIERLLDIPPAPDGTRSRSIPIPGEHDRHTQLAHFLHFFFFGG